MIFTKVHSSSRDPWHLRQELVRPGSQEAEAVPLRHEELQHVLASRRQDHPQAGRKLQAGWFSLILLKKSSLGSIFLNSSPTKSKSSASP